MPYPLGTVFPSSGIFPGLDDEVDPPDELLPIINWDPDHDRYFHQGVDRGVLYPKNANPVAWLGITGVEEGADSSPSVLYRDGVIYYSSVDPGDFTGKLTTFWYPDEFAECAGIPEATPGFFVDNQRPKQFSLSYRSLIGSGQTGDMFGYQIHLIYNATAQIGAHSRTTISEDGTEIDELSFDLVCTPIQLPGWRPSAHYIIDTRNLSAETVEQLEAILYGNGLEYGRLPSPEELHDIMRFGDRFEIIDRGAGIFTIRGAAKNFEELEPGIFRIRGANAVVNGNGYGLDSITITDTP